nr:glycosyltransferase family 4 protein [uncultured Methanoregula sp.]
MMLHKDNKIKIGIITPPIALASITPLSNLIDILSPLSNSLFLITGNAGYAHFKNDPRLCLVGINHNSEKKIMLRIVKFFLLQIRMSFVLMKNIRKYDFWIFFLGGQELVLPMIIIKLFRKKGILLFSGSSTHAQYHDKSVAFIRILTTIDCILCNKIILYSKCLISDWHFESYHHKILIAPRHFIDFNKFTFDTPLSSRPNLIGYVGRLSPEKGIQHFVSALPDILCNQNNLHFFIGGDGQLKKAIEEKIVETKMLDHVDLADWIPHDDLPKKLKQLRLLILPSYTEGLPNIMLEAMACGTPVLATPVGAIPEVLYDNETGFIMKNNSPDCISENVIRALDSNKLEQISEAGRLFVEKEYTFEKIFLRWKHLIDKI